MPDEQANAREKQPKPGPYSVPSEKRLVYQARVLARCASRPWTTAPKFEDMPEEKKGTRSQGKGFDKHQQKLLTATIAEAATQPVAEKEHELEETKLPKAETYVFNL